MNDPFWSASMRKCRPPGAPAFAYFAKVLARFSENNVLACVQATMDYRSPGGQFLGMPKRVFRSALRRVPKSFAHSRGNRTFFPELLRQRHLSRFWSSRKLRHRDCGRPISPREMQRSHSTQHRQHRNTVRNLTLLASHPRMELSPVMHFFDLLRLWNSPAGTRWAALLYGRPLRRANP
jgi:hypothetical protein